MARRVLQGAAVMAQDAPAEGIHQWLSLPAPWTANALRAARDQGLSVASSDAFRAGVDAPTPSACRWAPRPIARSWNRRWERWPG